MTDDLNSQKEKEVLNNIASQVEAYFQSHQSSVKVIDVLLNLDLFKITDSIVHKHPTYDKLSFIRLAVFRRLKGIKNYKNIRLYKDELALLNITNIPTKRAYNNFIKRNITTTILNDVAYNIISISAQKSIVLDILSTAPKSMICSKISRHKQQSIELTKIGRDVLYPNIKLDIGKNAKYKKTTLLNSLSYVCSHRMFCNNGLDNMRDEHTDLLVPNGDTMIYHCSKFESVDVDNITEMLNGALRVIIDYGFKIYPLMRSRKIRLAIDKHDRRYYGDENNIYVCNGQKDRGTTNKFTFITCSVVTRGIRFIIGAVPLMDKEPCLKAIDYLITHAMKKFRVDCVLLDRGFNGVDFVNYFQSRKINFIMPQQRYDTVKG